MRGIHGAIPPPTHAYAPLAEFPPSKPGNSCAYLNNIKHLPTI